MPRLNASDDEHSSRPPVFPFAATHRAASLIGQKNESLILVPRRGLGPVFDATRQSVFKQLPSLSFKASRSLVFGKSIGQFQDFLGGEVSRSLHFTHDRTATLQGVSIKKSTSGKFCPHSLREYKIMDLAIRFGLAKFLESVDFS